MAVPELAGRICWTTGEVGSVGDVVDEGVAGLLPAVEASAEGADAVDAESCGAGGRALALVSSLGQVQ